LTALYEIAHLLESADAADQRVRRVLELLGEPVPYHQCALLEARIGHEPRVVVVPETTDEERVVLTWTLVDLFGKLVDTSGHVRPPTLRPSGAHLAVPLVGLDQVIGVLFVRSSMGEYTEEHLRTLSLVAANLAAYFTTLRARAELAERARERDEARRAAEAANRAKDEFLALVSSELKTPLSSILAWAQILRSTTIDVAARVHALDELERQARTQAKLVDDILDLACVASAKLRLNLRLIEDPAGLIRATIEGLRLEAERKSVRLESDLDAGAMPLVVDPDRIVQVVSILIAHAIMITPVGGRIEVRLEPTAEYARIRVIGGGGDISREALPHAFDRFGQAAGAGTGAEGGRGVGLAIVKDLVEMHGGRVRAESPGPEPGATFTIELPRVPGKRPASAPRRTGEAGERADERVLAGIHVLIVDHDPGLREAFQSVLEDYGAGVTAVASAPEALAVLERAPPDVLLFGDLAPRGESVYDLVRQVTARACPLPIASISAWRLEERERELAAGFRLHLAKPLDVGALVAAVAELAGRTKGKAPRLFALPGEDPTPNKRGD
jgi:signal transduction histidine kinase